MPAQTDIPRVLCVDAGRDGGEEAGDLLDRASASLDVVRAGSSTDALEALADSSFDCVVSRSDLPDETGVTLLERVREDHPDLPFVLFPREGSEAVASDAISAGVTEYLRVRPDDDQSAELASLVREAVASGGNHEEAGWELAADASPVLDLATQANLLQQIFEQVPVSLYVKDTEGRHLLMSDYDTSPVEATGKTDLEVYDADLARESYEDDMQVVETGESIHNKEEYSPEVDGWVLTSKVPWYGEDGEINGLIGVTRFITEKKEYEREIERKNERLERFASVVSHDLRNPLTVAKGRLEYVAEEMENEHVDAAIDALDRMEALVDDVLELARQGQTIDETELVTLSSAVEQAWANAATGEATLELDGDCRLQADESRLVELLGNLVRNSVEHNSTSSRPQADDAIDHGSESVTVCAGTDADGFYVEDDGPGIPDDEKADVFEPGHTTAADGTGFGLAIVEEIVDAHGWEIAVTDATDGGARFEVTNVDVRD